MPLAVDRDRMRGIDVVTRFADPTLVILDDAFHRTTVPKDLDILLLDAERPFGNGRLLPYGTLREGASATARAGAVVFTRATESIVPEKAVRFTEEIPVFFARHEPVALTGRDGGHLAAASLTGSKIALFSGIARHHSFEKTAVGFGLDPEVSFRYDDHHEYTPDDIAAMMDECGPGTVFVTTAKDLVKVAPLIPADTRLLVLEVRMEIDRMEDLLAPVL